MRTPESIGSSLRRSTRRTDRPRSDRCGWSCPRPSSRIWSRVVVSPARRRRTSEGRFLHAQWQGTTADRTPAPSPDPTRGARLHVDFAAVSRRTRARIRALSSGEGERLDQVVVGSGIQALHRSSTESLASGQHRERSLAARRCPADLETGHLGQHHIDRCCAEVSCASRSGHRRRSRPP